MPTSLSRASAPDVRPAGVWTNHEVADHPAAGFRDAENGGDAEQRLGQLTAADGEFDLSGKVLAGGGIQAYESGVMP
ncbi:hypothetical protein ABZ702_16105 [Streptomyces cyaneofuscatus]|uniref:hypothetical protein n=1 Tax=Streptomyces cyaneofuscatus TaxID=66883 RepID=UPI0033CB9AD8